ncbi:MAG: hypothetical protein SF182_24060 [Deltaproteobacteria bacterium]|nr:hypothetical protein [Deltaproteobacteria bacterium]
MWKHHLGYALAALLSLAAGPALGCTGDCDGDGEVAINEAIRGVNIALGNAPVGECAQFDANGDGSVAVNELIAAVAAVLDGCAEPTPSPTPDPDSPATLTIVSANGQEFVSGRSYGFDLADLRPGNLRIALYGGLLTEDHPDTLAEVRLSQTLLDGAGNPIRDGEGRRRIVYMRFNHFPLQTGTFHCGEGLPATPGSLLTFNAYVTVRNDELFQELTLDEYFGYPRVTTAVDCTLNITSLADGLIVASFESHMLNAQANDLAFATGTLRVPKPTCTYPQLIDSPQTCYPWAFE